MQIRFPFSRCSLAATALVAVAMLAACTAPPVPAPPMVGGRAVVLGPEPGFDPARAADPWWRWPQGAATRFAPVELDGRLVLRIDAPAPGEPSNSLLGRRLAVPLLSMPYLHWAWYLEPAIYEGGPGDGLDRGLKLSIGFYGGHPSSPQITDRWFGGPDNMPAFDRRIDLVFGGIGQGRGLTAMQHLSATTESGLRRELRPSQGGESGAWKLEALDLARLYAEFWPRDRIDRTQIVFVAIGGLPGRPPATTPPLPLGYAAEISLTR